MAKRPPGVERYFFTQGSYVHDGNRYEIEIGKPIPNTIVLYWGDFHHVQNALYDEALVNPRIRRQLEGTINEADIKAALRSVIADTGIGLSIEELYSFERSLNRLSDQSLRDIVRFVALPRYVFPKNVNQWTFQEARNTCFAISQTPEFNRNQWHELESERGLRFARQDDRIEIKFLPSPLIGARSITDCYVALNRNDQRAVLCFQLVLHAVITSATLPVRISLDEIIGILRMEARNSDQRVELRRLVWTWLKNFDSMMVIGKRRRNFGVKGLRSEDTLIRIEAFTGLPDEYGLPPDSPLDVELSAGKWLETHRRNKKVVTYIGNVRRLAGIPAGKPSGAWAQSIGLALNQLWREKAAMKRSGETAEGKREGATLFATRYELSTMFPPSPTVEEIGKVHPVRAREYWELATDTLSDDPNHRVIRHLDEQPPSDKRQGWFDAWLHERIEIRPTREIVEQIKRVKAGKPKPKRRKSVPPADKPLASE